MHDASSDSQPADGRFTRTVDLYGRDGFDAIRAARVAVVGLGGVGAHAATALARSGIGELVLVDFDLLTESSLNRHPVAGPADVGRPKVDILGAHIRKACADTRVILQKEFCSEQTAPGLFSPQPDLVIDAIDSLNPKVGLLVWCARSGQPVLSSMGSAGRKDFTRIRFGDISETRICPLARHVRKRLRRRGVESGIACVYSIEEPAAALPPDTGDRTLERGRVRNRLPSQISIPGSFGYALAASALELITGCNQVPPVA